jgi:hypothetical protein
MTNARPDGIALQPGDTRKGTSYIYAEGKSGEPESYLDRVSRVRVYKPMGMGKGTFSRLSQSQLDAIFGREARKASRSIEPELKHAYGGDKFVLPIRERRRLAAHEMRAQARLGRMPLVRIQR